MLNIKTNKSGEGTAKNADDPQPPSSISRKDFRKKYYPNASAKDWNDWRWQLKNRITSLENLSRILVLSTEEKEALVKGKDLLPFAVTPYYASLIDPINFSDPLRMSVIPRIEELNVIPCEMVDPLGETSHEVSPGLIHRYPDRVLFLATSFCSTYCRYCTRARAVSDNKPEYGSLENRIRQAIAYISDHTEIRDVLISGGDPLTLPDEVIEIILSAFRKIPHVEFLRIGTKTPTVLPQRITPKLTSILKRFHPLFISIHSTHDREFTPEAVTACEKLADAGIPLGSQTVLLKGINDNPEIMKTLMHKLLKSRVRPYYLYQCDPVKGTGHFRTSIAKGLEIISNLRGYTSGYAVPTYVIDAPGGGGKIPIASNNICGVEDGKILLINFEGKVYKYPMEKEFA